MTVLRRKVLTIPECIEREALLSELQEEIEFETSMYTEEQNKYFNMGLKCAIRDVKSQPAADVAPVVHGHFVHDGPRFSGGVDWWHCSSCGRVASGVETRFCYCPFCGAKMDGDTE